MWISISTHHRAASSSVPPSKLGQSLFCCEGSAAIILYFIRQEGEHRHSAFLCVFVQTSCTVLSSMSQSFSATWRSRSQVSSVISFHMSMPMPRRPVRAAITGTVPLPQNGSRTAACRVEVEQFRREFARKRRTVRSAESVGICGQKHVVRTFKIWLSARRTRNLLAVCVVRLASKDEDPVADSRKRAQRRCLRRGSHAFVLSPGDHVDNLPGGPLNFRREQKRLGRFFAQSGPTARGAFSVRQQSKCETDAPF